MSGVCSLEDSKSLIETISLKKVLFVRAQCSRFCTKSLNRLFLMMKCDIQYEGFVFWCLATKMAGNDGKEIESFLSKIDKVCKEYLLIVYQMSRIRLF